MFNFDRIVIWGYRIRSLSSFVHTHAWIHQGFYLGFKKLGYDVYWFDDKDAIKEKIPNDFNFKNTLFITMGVEDNIFMPYRDDCYYILHNPDVEEMFDRGIPRNRVMFQQVYGTLCKSRNLKRVYPDDPFQLYNPNSKDLYFPWATDIFPEDIEKNIQKIKHFNLKNYFYLIGMIVKPWEQFAFAAKKKNIYFVKTGGFEKRKVSIKENQKLIQESFMAPALQCPQQIDMGYIPCRIFKNISYGKFGITNNPTVNELFNNELIYHPVANKLFDKAYDIITQGKINYDILEKHMRFVAEKHTYLNRCQTLLDIFKIILETKT